LPLASFLAISPTAALSATCPLVYLNGPTVGALNAESPKRTFSKFSKR